MFNNLIGKNKELGRFLFCERYTLPPVKNAMYIAEGQELKRGAVVDVNGVLVGTNSLMPYAVLEFDCDTRDGGKEASVFIKGEFNFDKLHFASGLSKSDLDNIVYNGSGIGIVIKPYEYAEGFSPLMVPAGTSQSNPLMNAEETERMINAMKPIDDMTLRFEFSKKDYNPETAGVGSAGTWTKVDSPTLNIWDWTNENESWATAFGGGDTTTPGAFADYENNKVRLIAAGDTSSVSDFSRFFQNCYAIVAICDLDTSGATTVFLMFSHCENLEFMPKFFNFSNANINNGTTAIFQYCKKMKTNPRFSLPQTYPQDINNCFEGCESLEKFEPFDFSYVRSCYNLFTLCTNLRELPNFDTPSVTNMRGMFGGKTSTRDVEMHLSKIPDLNYSSVEDMRLCFENNMSLVDIGGLELPSVTDVRSMFKNCRNVKFGMLKVYNMLLARGGSLTNYSDCFLNCGIDTPEGRAALAQIPQSWGGLAEG